VLLEHVKGEEQGAESRQRCLNPPQYDGCLHHGSAIPEVCKITVGKEKTT
jgi:hypothetical protein